MAAPSNTFGDDLSRQRERMRRIMVEEAARAGVSAYTMLAIAEIESPGYDPHAKNPGSSAGGLFQFIDKTWEDFSDIEGWENPPGRKEGRGRYNPVLAARAGAALTAQNARSFRNRTGREPTPAESYVLHQQGAGAGGKLLTAPREDKALDHIPGSDKKKRERLQKNMPGGLAFSDEELEAITVGQYRDQWLGRAERAMASVLEEFPSITEDLSPLATAEVSTREGDLSDEEVEASIARMAQEPVQHANIPQGNLPTTGDTWLAWYHKWGLVTQARQLFGFDELTSQFPSHVLPPGTEVPPLFDPYAEGLVPEDLAMHSEHYVWAKSPQEVEVITQWLRKHEAWDKTMEDASGWQSAAGITSLAADPSVILSVGGLGVARAVGGGAKAMRISQQSVRAGTASTWLQQRVSIANAARKFDQSTIVQGSLLGATAVGMTANPDTTEDQLAIMAAAGGLLAITLRWNKLSQLNTASMERAQLERELFNTHQPIYQAVAPGGVRFRTTVDMPPPLTRPMAVSPEGEIVPLTYSDDYLGELLAGYEGRAGRTPQERLRAGEIMLEQARQASASISEILPKIRMEGGKLSPEDVGFILQASDLHADLYLANRQLVVLEEWANMSILESISATRKASSINPWAAQARRSQTLGTQEAGGLKGLQKDVLDWLGSAESAVGGKQLAKGPAWGADSTEAGRIVIHSLRASGDEALMNKADELEAIWAMESHQIPASPSMVDEAIEEAESLRLSEPTPNTELISELKREGLIPGIRDIEEELLTPLTTTWSSLAARRIAESPTEDAFEELAKEVADQLGRSLAPGREPNIVLTLSSLRRLRHPMVAELAKRVTPALGKEAGELTDDYLKALVDAIESARVTDPNVGRMLKALDQPIDEALLRAVLKSDAIPDPTVQGIALEAATIRRSASHQKATWQIEDLVNEIALPANARGMPAPDIRNPYPGHAKLPKAQDDLGTTTAKLEGVLDEGQAAAIPRATEESLVSLADAEWKIIFQFARNTAGQDFDSALALWVKGGQLNETTAAALKLAREGQATDLSLFKTVREMYRRVIGSPERTTVDRFVDDIGSVSRMVDGKVVVRSNYNGQLLMDWIKGEGEYARLFPQRAEARRAVWNELKGSVDEQELSDLLLLPREAEDFLYLKQVDHLWNRDNDVWSETAAAMMQEEKVKASVRAELNAINEVRKRKNLRARVTEGDELPTGLGPHDFGAWLDGNLPNSIDELWNGGALTIRTPWAPISKMGEVMQPTYHSMLSPFMTTRYFTARLADMPYVPDVGRFGISAEARISSEEKWLGLALRDIETPYLRLAAKAGKVRTPGEASPYFGGDVQRRFRLSGLAFLEAIKNSSISRKGMPAKMADSMLESSMLPPSAYRVLVSMTYRNAGRSILRESDEFFNASIRSMYGDNDVAMKIKAFVGSPYADDLSAALEESALGVKKYLDHYKNEIAKRRLFRGEQPALVLPRPKEGTIGGGLRAALSAEARRQAVDPRSAWYLPRKLLFRRIAAEEEQFVTHLTKYIQRVIDENPEVAAMVGPRAARNAAAEVTDNIINLPMQAEQALPGYTPSALQGRRLVLPDDEPWIHRYLDSDVASIVDRYHRSVIPAVFLKQEMGSISPDRWIRILEREKNSLIRRFPNQRAALESRYVKDVKRMEGVWGVVSNRLLSANANPTTQMVTTQILGYNYLRHGGGFMISSMTDPARFVSVFGLKDTATLMPKLLRDRSLRAATAIENLEAGIATELAAATHVSNNLDMSDEAMSALPNMMRKARNTFFLFEGLAVWNQGLKSLAGSMTQIEMMKIARRAAKAQLTATDQEFMKRYGMGDDMAVRFYQEWRGAGRPKMKGVMLAETNKWKDRALARDFSVILKSQVDDVILTPMAGSKPLAGHAWYGRILTQYLSHMFESTGIIMLSDFTRKEWRLVHGALVAVALGGMVHVMKQKLYGKDIEWDDPGKFLFHAFDRSGLGAALMQANTMTENVSGGRVSIQAMMGFPTHSYHYRTPLTVFGPTAGLGEDVVRLFGEINEPGPAGASVVGRSRRLIPLQNWWVWTMALNKYERDIKKYYTRGRRQWTREQRELKEAQMHWAQRHKILIPKPVLDQLRNQSYEERKGAPQ